MKPEDIKNKPEQELSEEDLDGATGGGIGGTGGSNGGSTGGSTGGEHGRPPGDRWH